MKGLRVAKSQHCKTRHEGMNPGLNPVRPPFLSRRVALLTLLLCTSERHSGGAGSRRYEVKSTDTATRKGARDVVCAKGFFGVPEDRGGVDTRTIWHDARHLTIFHVAVTSLVILKSVNQFRGSMYTVLHTASLPITDSTHVHMQNVWAHCCIARLEPHT